MNIAFIRGSHLNPWELQNYAPLAARNAFHAIGGNWPFYPHAFVSTGISITRAQVWGDSLARFSPVWAERANRLRSWTLGESFGLRDLASVVGDAEIYHTAEVYSTQTYQALTLARERGAKVIVTVWENLPGAGERHPRRRQRKQTVLCEADGFVAVTNTTRDLLIREGADPSRIRVIPVGVDRTAFYPAARDRALASRWSIPDDRVVVLFMGRLVPEKGIEDLLEAIRLLSVDARDRSLFCFVGAGPLSLQIRAAQQRSPEQIRLIPFEPYNRVPLIHNLADVFVLPSRPAPKWEEQFGYVLIEAMACGKPVISTRSGSIPDVVGEAGLLIPHSDPQALSQALTRWILNADERKHHAVLSLKRASDCFDVQNISRDIEDFYQEVCRR